jgi:hypothetical protein
MASLSVGDDYYANAMTVDASTLAVTVESRTKSGDKRTVGFSAWCRQVTQHLELTRDEAEAKDDAR